MNTKLTRLTLSAAILSTVVILPACQETQLKDMKDYWPMAVGNLWVYEDREDPAYAFGMQVVQDWSTSSLEAWELYMEFSHNGKLYDSARLFLVWHKNKLVSLSDEKLLKEILNAPNDPLPDNPEIFVMMPRFIEEGTDPKEFQPLENGFYMYTSTGVFAAAVYRLGCPVNPTPIQPADYPIDPNTPCVVQMEDLFCNSVPIIAGTAVFGKNVGPVDFQQSILTFAVVNGVEYGQ